MCYNTSASRFAHCDCCGPPQSFRSNPRYYFFFALLGAMESSAALATRNFTTIDCTSTRVETYPLAAMFLMISIIRGELGASAEESAYPLACGENIQFVA